MDTLNLQTIYCQGAKGAYSHIAAGKITGAEAAFVRTFEEVFAKVSASEGKSAGLVPVENSTAGAVGEVMSLLVQYDLYIGCAVNLKIDHNLCARDIDKISDVKRIYSHHQALMQCSKFLSRLSVPCIETANTAISAAFAAKEGGGSAAICSASAAQLYGLDIMGGDICNEQNNQTRFAAVMTKDLHDKLLAVGGGNTGKNCAVYFEIENRTGSLHSALDAFKQLGINLVSIHSLPIKGKVWSYGFYVETDTIEPERVQGAIDILKKSLQKIKLLGIYTTVNA